MFHVRPYSRLSALPQEAASISAPQKNADPFRTPAGSFHVEHLFTYSRVSLQGAGLNDIGPPQGRRPDGVVYRSWSGLRLMDFPNTIKEFLSHRYVYSLLEPPHGKTRDPSRLFDLEITVSPDVLLSVARISMI